MVEYMNSKIETIPLIEQETLKLAEARRLFMRNYVMARIDTTTPINMPAKLNVSELELLERARINSLKSLARARVARQAPSELVIPNSQQLFARPFTSKFKKGLFLGSPSFLGKSLESEQFRHVRRASLSIFNHGEDALKPNEEALQRTEQAAKIFFATAYRLLVKKGKTFPLATYNKCLGMVSVPNSQLVMIAVSQDKIPALDQGLRRELGLFLEELNNELKEKSLKWTFELVCIPTHSQYFMPRTLSKDTHLPAIKDDIEPHTRCVEVALMVALNKVGRLKRFTPKEAGVMAFSGTLWATPDAKISSAIDGFAGASRNTKHLKKSPLQMTLDDGNSAWIDIWKPCACHCEIYQYQMAAIAAAGAPGTSFSEPRSEAFGLGAR